MLTRRLVVGLAARVAAMTMALGLLYGLVQLESAVLSALPDGARVAYRESAWMGPVIGISAVLGFFFVLDRLTKLLMPRR
ncbi:MAG: hypothetical protein KUG77_26270 [Nannocystaceae bacterium]|nr:hypothetical protein [Nannocystaceae bacterium]